MNTLLSSTSRLFEMTRTAKRLPHIVLAIVLMPIIIVGGAVLLGLPVQLVLRQLLPGGLKFVADQPLLFGLVFALILSSSFGLTFGLLWLWLRFFEKRPFFTLGFEREGALWKYGRGLLIGFAQFGLAVGLPALFGWVVPETGREPFEGWQALAGVLIVTLGWVVQGAAEETLTRGWLMGVVGARYKPWLGVLISSLMFMLLHGLNPNIGPLPLINLFLFGVFTALWVLWEGGLWGVCAQHAVWNWAQGNVFGMEVSGGASSGPILWNLQEAGPDLITGGAFGPEGGLAVTGILLVSIGVLVALLRHKNARQ